MIRYLSVCSGIEAASMAWGPLGWQAVAVSEIEAFPRAVLAHHYPSVPNWGDMTKFKDWPDADIDLLVGGTPCQSFSVAGLRKGLADPRGSLLLTYLAITDRYRPKWLVWENVPGVLSADNGRAFGSLLGGLAELGYGFAYRVLDAQHFGLAQRRQRVFVVGHLGDWRRAAAVLFERESLSGHPAPRREAGQGTPISPALRARANSSHRADTQAFIPDTAMCLNAHGGSGRIDGESETFVAHALRADGFDASEDGTGRGTPLVPVAFDTTQITSVANYSNPQPGDPCHPLAAGAHPPAIAFSVKDYGADAGDIAPTLRAGGHDRSHANGGVMPAIAFNAWASQMGHGDIASTLDVGKGDGMAVMTRGSNLDIGDIAGTFGSNADRASGSAPMYQRGMQVRRLTPLECCRLQGFPDDYLDITYRGKPAADGPKYKALGNSMAVPVMAWIGRRIQAVEELE